MKLRQIVVYSFFLIIVYSCKSYYYQTTTYVDTFKQMNTRKENFFLRESTTYKIDTLHNFITRVTERHVTDTIHNFVSATKNATASNLTQKQSKNPMKTDKNRSSGWRETLEKVLTCLFVLAILLLLVRK